MRHVLATVALCALFGLAVAPARAETLPASAFPFAAPAAIQHVGESKLARGVRVRDVRLHIGGSIVRGRFIEPVARGRHPGALFVHWLGDNAATTNLSEFAPEMLRLAKAGIVTFAIDAPWAQPKWFEAVRSPATDYADSLKAVAQLRGALDALVAQSDVDPGDVAVVGHDFGAMYAAVLSGLDSRPRYYAFIAGTTTFSEWYLLGKKPADVTAYEAQMAPLDPLPYLAASHGRDYLFQFAVHDEYVPLANARAFFDAAPTPKAFMLYDDTHAMRSTKAVDDRVQWLVGRLKDRAKR